MSTKLIRPLLLYLLLWRLCALACRDVWGYEATGSSLTLQANANDIIIGGVSIIMEGFVSKISTGGLHQWTYSIAANGTVPNYERGYVSSVGFAGSSNDVVFTASFVGAYTAPFVGKLHSLTGELCWNQSRVFSLSDRDDIMEDDDLPIQLSAIAGDAEGHVYVLGHNLAGQDVLGNMIFKFNSSNGARVWKQQCSPGIMSSYPYHTFAKLAINEPYVIRISGIFFDHVSNSFVEHAQYFDLEQGHYLYSTTTPTKFRQPELRTARVNGDTFSTAGIGRDRHFGESIDSNNHFTVRKNHIQSGSYFSAVSPSLSVPARCPGLSWSMYDLYTTQTQYAISCDYYFARGDSLSIALIFIFTALPVFFFSLYYEFSLVYTLGSALSTFCWSSDLAYFVTRVYYHKALFILSGIFLLLPLLHFLYLMRCNAKHREVRQAFSLPQLWMKWVCVSVGDDCAPHWDSSSSLPTAMTDEMNTAVLVFAWITAIMWQVGYAIVWIIITSVMVVPWALVHGPFLVSSYLLGYILYVLGLYSHPSVKAMWLHITYQPEQYYESSPPPDLKGDGGEVTEIPGEGDAHDPVRGEVTVMNPLDDPQWEVTTTYISLLLLGYLPAIAIESANNHHMHRIGSITILSLLLKGLFVLNILNRIAILYGTRFLLLLRASLERMRPVADTAFAMLETFDPSDLLLLMGDNSSGSASLDGAQVHHEVSLNEEAEGIELALSAKTAEEIRTHIRQLEERVRRMRAYLDQRERCGGTQVLFSEISGTVNVESDSVFLLSRERAIIAGEGDHEKTMEGYSRRGECAVAGLCVNDDNDEIRL